MKNKHCITLLFASLLSTAGAVAASWTPPTVTGQELKTGETQYAYNVKANGFLNANSGKTTIVADEGLPLFITSSTNDTYLMGTTEDEGLTYTYVYYEDNQISKTGGEAGRTHLNWSIVAQGDGTYYIRPDRNDENYGEDYFPEMWMGWKNDGTDIIYPLIDGYEETYGITWKFVNETEYFHFVNLKALSDAMSKAQEYGFDITAALAVYNNTASTNEELAAATTELKTKIREYEIEHATNDHPVDLSDISEGASVPDMTAKAEELNAVMGAAMENVEAYATLERTYEIGDSILNVLEGEVNDDIEALAAYMDEIDITTILATYPYTTPELGEIIDKLDLLTQSAQHSLITEGTDVTEFITNPSFADGLNGWTVEGDATKIVTENDLIAMDGIVCDVSQTLLGMPNGVYELTLQGFQRTDWNFESMDETWTTQKGQDSLRNQVHSYIYLNEGVQAVKHSFDDGINEDFTVETVGTDNWDIRYGTKSGVMMPNTTNGAKQYFEKGYYKNTIQAFVIDGKLTFGIRNEGDQGARWGCIDNITLRYVGTDLEKAIALLQEKLEDVAPYLDEKMNGDIKTKMSEGYTKGQELVNNPDADFDEVIDVIAALTQSLEGVDESIEAFKKLAHANEVAAKDLAYEGVAATESGQQLQALYDTNNAGYQNESADLTVEKIDEVAEQYLELALKAKIEKGIKANDDLTYILTNPSFEDQWGLGEGVNGVYNAPFGWTFMVDSIVCTKAEDMNAAGLNNFTSPDKNVDCTDGEYGYCLQTGDFPDVYMYQEIEGLPAGYYKVTVDMVVPNNNYDYRLAGQRLYVNDAAMYYGYEEEYDLDLLETGHPYEVERTFGEYDEVTIEENGELGDKGPLNTLEVVVHVAANEPLKLGVRTDGHWEYTYKRTEAPEGWNNCGWCKFDNVRLSCVSIDSGESIDETVATGKVKSQEVYSIDGIKLPGLQKGVNILRQTLEDGTVVTRKVIVK